MKSKRGSSDGGSAQAKALAADALDYLLDGNPSPEHFCGELAKVFKVGAGEIALLRLEKGSLKFLSPAELKTAGSIPLSSSSAVSAHTATTKKVELFNNFSKVKHASVFEHVKLGAKQEQQPEQAPIQKLISAPVLDDDGDVLGVIQICRKGSDPACGPDFSLEDLQRLELAAKVLARTTFMQPE